MLRTQKDILKISQQENRYLRKLCRYSKNLYNQTLYNTRQHLFATNTFLRYEEVYHQLKQSENYKMLLTGCAQQTMKVVDRAMRAFYKGKEKSHLGVNLPSYLKKDGYFTLIFTYRAFRIKKGRLYIGFSKTFRDVHKPQQRDLVIKLPKNLRHLHSKHFKELRIIPKYGAKFFEIELVVNIAPKTIQNHQKNYLAIDLGLDNFATIVTSNGTSMILDGRNIKSINRWYNKKRAKLQCMKDKQAMKGITKNEARMLRKRTNKLNELMNIAVARIIQLCKNEGIARVVIGDFAGIKQGMKLGKRNNQNFMAVPFWKFKRKLQAKCQYHGILYTEIEESYTSKTCFKCREIRKANRIHRGLYRCSNCNFVVNADVNGALNILKKVVPEFSLKRIRNSGLVTRPVRIRLLQTPHKLNPDDKLEVAVSRSQMVRDAWVQISTQNSKLHKTLSTHFKNITQL